LKPKSTKKKSPKSKAKKPATRASKAPAKTTLKLPVDTFDAWIAKQVRASKKEGAVTSSTHVEVVVPKGTFELWIEKQKPRENVSPKLDTEAAPDTFELWMSKQVALKATADADQEAVPAEAPAQTNTA